MSFFFFFCQICFFVFRCVSYECQVSQFVDEKCRESCARWWFSTEDCVRTAISKTTLFLAFEANKQKKSRKGLRKNFGGFFFVPHNSLMSGAMPCNFQCGPYWNGTGYDDRTCFNGAIFFPDYTYKLLSGSARDYQWADPPYKIVETKTFTYKIEEGMVICEQAIPISDRHAQATFTINEKGFLAEFCSNPTTKGE